MTTLAANSLDISNPRPLTDRYIEWHDRWGWRIFWWLCCLGTGVGVVIWGPLDMSDGDQFVALPIVALLGGAMIWLLLIVPVLVLSWVLVSVFSIVDNIRGAE